MLVTLWTSKGEQIDLNLRDDVTIGQLRQILVAEFSYAPNVQIMYSTRMCNDSAAVDDYPPGTLIIIGQRAAQQQQQQQPAHDPYGRHASSGGANLRTGQSGGMRAAAERKYANDYASTNARTNASMHGYNSPQQQQQHYQHAQANPYAGHRGAPAPQQQPAYPQQQQQYNSYAQPQQQSSASSNPSYANYMSSAAARGAESPQKNMGGWDSRRAPQQPQQQQYATTSSAYGAQQQSAYQPTSSFVPPPDMFGTPSAAAAPSPTPLRATQQQQQYQQQQYQSPSYGSAGSASATAGTPNTPSAAYGGYGQQQPQRATPSAQQPIVSPAPTDDDDVVFPDITITAEIIGQGSEKTLSVAINGGATVAELVSLLAERAPDVGASLRPSQDSMKIMFFSKYVRNWAQPIRKVPLLDGARVLVCTGDLVNEANMTLHSAERAMAGVRAAMEECQALGEVPMPKNKRNYHSEQLMKALLNLDSLQGVEEDIRQRRKALVKEVSALSDVLEQA